MAEEGKCRGAVGREAKAAMGDRRCMPRLQLRPGVAGAWDSCRRGCPVLCPESLQRCTHTKMSIILVLEAGVNSSGSEINEIDSPSTQLFRAKTRSHPESFSLSSTSKSCCSVWHGNISCGNRLTLYPGGLCNTSSE